MRKLVCIYAGVEDGKARRGCGLRGCLLCLILLARCELTPHASCLMPPAGLGWVGLGYGFLLAECELTASSYSPVSLPSLLI